MEALFPAAFVKATTYALYLALPFVASAGKEAANAYTYHFIAFGMVRPVREPTAYRSRRGLSILPLGYRGHLHYANIPMHNAEIFKAVKMLIFR